MKRLFTPDSNQRLRSAGRGVLVRFTAAEFGNALASLSVQKKGTAPSMPFREEIDKIL
jgi:sugar/nucleoside kinase (ribokinase family)